MLQCRYISNVGLYDGIKILYLLDNSNCNVVTETTNQIRTQTVNRVIEKLKTAVQQLSEQFTNLKQGLGQY